MKKHTIDPNWVGVVDGYGYLICRPCRENEHGHPTTEAYVYGSPHAEEQCDHCTRILKDSPKYRLGPTTRR